LVHRGVVRPRREELDLALREEVAEAVALGSEVRALVDLISELADVREAREFLATGLVEATVAAGDLGLLVAPRIPRGEETRTEEVAAHDGVAHIVAEERVVVAETEADREVRDRLVGVLDEGAPRGRGASAPEGPGGLVDVDVAEAL